MGLKEHQEQLTSGMGGSLLALGGQTRLQVGNGGDVPEEIFL